MTRRRYWVFFLLFLFNVICYLDRINMSVAGHSIAGEFGLSPISLGYLFSSFLWAYVLMMLPGGKMVDLLGVHRMAAIGAAFWSVAQMLSGAATGYWTLLATRLGLGVGEAPTFPVSYRGVRDWAPYTERGVAVGCIQAGTLLGPALSAPLVAWLIDSTSWRISFVVTGAIGLVWVAVWRLFVSTPEETKWIPEPERQKILAERHGTEPVADGEGVGYLGLLRSPSMWGLALSQGCGVYTIYLYLSWLPDYLQTQRHLSIMKSGVFTMVPFLVGAAVIVIMNLIGDKMLTPGTMRAGKRRLVVVACLVLSALGMLIPYTDSLTMLMILTIFPISFGGTSTSTNAALCNDLLRNKADAGRAFAFMVLGGNTFGLLAPIVTGYIVQATGSFSSAFVVAGVLSLVGAVASLTLTRHTLGEEQPALALA